MKISLGCDEAAFDLKEAIKKHLEDAGHEVVDNGVGPGKWNFTRMWQYAPVKR